MSDRTVAICPVKTGSYRSVSDADSRINLSCDMIRILLFELLECPVPFGIGDGRCLHLLLSFEHIVGNGDRPIDVQHNLFLRLLFLLSLDLHRHVAQKVALSDLERHTFLDVFGVETVVNELYHLLLFGDLVHLVLDALGHALAVLQLLDALVVLLNVEGCPCLLLFLRDIDRCPIKVIPHIFNKVPAHSD